MDVTKEIITVSESLPTSLEPIDFLERLCLRMGIERDTSQLVYRWNNEPASTRRPLMADSDVMKLYTDNITRKQKWRSGNKEVKICVDNLNKVSRTAAARKEAEKKHKRDEAEAALAKSSEKSCATEFGICREKLRCPHNQTGEAYCWTNPSDPQKRCQQLEAWELQAWARMMADGKCDRDCTLPPNLPLFDRLTAHQSERAGKKAGTSAVPSIVIHNHLGSALSDGNNTVNSSVVRSSDAPPSDAAVPAAPSRKVRTVPLPIREALAALHQLYPDSKYPSYEEPLKKEGFYYAENILHFANDTKVFTDKVGMPLGAVHSSHDEVDAHARKRRRSDDGTGVSVDQENVAPVA
ncbi:hypothetical protein K466DRAFT_579376 [Polyporus arcularius HHB13444]|uniref:Uncharacterized protein n=1 Tax=Polyporus arcularius HHB13444 TaxID=1314778 RepID=A0A5C3NP62_9APHY|nr:hypothetical protein K466DRAFT_579376 [Polyporus arcularius HHB13444]